MKHLLIIFTLVACAHEQKKPMQNTAYRYQDHDTGLSSTNVEKVQQALNNEGFNVEKNGILDSRTRTALQTFQQRENLAVTGDADPPTLRKLHLDPDEIYSRPSAPPDTRTNPPSDMNREPTTP